MNIDIDNIGNYSILYSIIMCVLKVEIFVIFCKVPGQHMSVLTVPALCSVDIIDRVHGLKLELPLSSPGSSETKVYVQIFPWDKTIFMGSWPFSLLYARSLCKFVCVIVQVPAGFVGTAPVSWLQRAHCLQICDCSSVGELHCSNTWLASNLDTGWLQHVMQQCPACSILVALGRPKMHPNWDIKNLSPAAAASCKAAYLSV